MGVSHYRKKGLQDRTQRARLRPGIFIAPKFSRGALAAPLVLRWPRPDTACKPPKKDLPYIRAWQRDNRFGTLRFYTMAEHPGEKLNWN
jgi:hypothetical protein